MITLNNRYKIKKRGSELVEELAQAKVKLLGEESKAKNRDLVLQLKVLRVDKCHSTEIA